MQMTNPKIKPALVIDSQAIRECFTKAFAPFVTSIEDFPDVTHGLLESIEEGGVFVMKDGEVLLGAMSVDIGDAFLKISVVAVDPSQKGRGLGRDFMQFAEEHARSLGLSELRLRTHVLMPQNVDFYTHLGWQVTSKDDIAVSMMRHI